MKIKKFIIVYMLLTMAVTMVSTCNWSDTCSQSSYEKNL